MANSKIPFELFSSSAAVKSILTVATDCVHSSKTLEMPNHIQMQYLWWTNTETDSLDCFSPTEY